MKTLSSLVTAAGAPAPRWPPVEGGLPTASVDALLSAQRDLLIRLDHECGEAPALWDAQYRPIIERMTRWFHLLPASREHHHFGAGGLLRHALESAVAAAGLFDRLIVGSDQPTVSRDQYRTGLRWAAVIGSMLHDCAKPMTDLEVTGEHTGAVWNPVQGSLLAWAEQAQESHYRIRWRTHRAGAHRIGAAIMLPRIVGPAPLSWLVGMSGQQALIDLVEAVLDGEQPGILPSILSDADRISVADDLARRGELNEDHRIDGTAAEHHIMDAARSLLRDGVWRPGGKVCTHAADGRVLLAWPRAGQDIADWLTRHHLPGIVRTPEAIANVLLDTGMAERIPGSSDTDAARGLHRFRTTDGLDLTGLRLRSGNALLPLLAGQPPAGDWTDGSTPSASPPDTGAASAAATDAPQIPGTGPQSGHARDPAPVAAAAPSVPWWRTVAECEIASAIVEDFALGKLPARLIHVAGPYRYLAYPDAFKGYGMQPLAAAKAMIESGIAEGDGSRIAQDLEHADFKKGVQIARSEALLNPARAPEMVATWFAAQADADVRDVGSRRYVSMDNLRRWAALFGDHRTILDAMAADAVISVGHIGDTEYARLGPTDAEMDRAAGKNKDKKGAPP